MRFGISATSWILPKNLRTRLRPVNVCAIVGLSIGRCSQRHHVRRPGAAPGSATPGYRCVGRDSPVRRRPARALPVVADPKPLSPKSHCLRIVHSIAPPRRRTWRFAGFRRRNPLTPSSWRILGCPPELVRRPPEDAAIIGVGRWSFQLDLGSDLFEGGLDLGSFTLVDPLFDHLW